ncbi:anti-sigma factor domain-containing protein [Microbacterium kyungheense]|uniref:Anti-sigma-K factor rskA n=1 Tax=Microbacterium kyungheense TaxID=1263636 RepID=A0A543F0U4_9MICO|nr:anti-sigma factor [Microbacterium kyungheense]TQM27448.1 anti-sigma-K factor rskA [Microbacterium kyungheense]
MTGDGERETDAAGQGAEPLIPPVPDVPASEAAAAAPVPAHGPTTDTVTVQAQSRRNWNRVIGGFAASLVVLTGVGFAVATINERFHLSPQAAALAEVDDAGDAASATVKVIGGGIATARWSADAGLLVLTTQRVAALGAGQTLAAWVMRDGDPFDAGTFDPDAAGSATLVIDDWKPAEALIITVERADDMITRPLGDTIARIPTE